MTQVPLRGDQSEDTIVFRIIALCVDLDGEDFPRGTYVTEPPLEMKTPGQIKPGLVALARFLCGASDRIAPFILPKLRRIEHEYSDDDIDGYGIFKLCEAIRALTRVRLRTPAMQKKLGVDTAAALLKRFTDSKEADVYAPKSPPQADAVAMAVLAKTLDIHKKITSASLEWALAERIQVAASERATAPMTNTSDVEYRELVIASSAVRDAEERWKALARSLVTDLQGVPGDVDGSAGLIARDDRAQIVLDPTPSQVSKISKAHGKTHKALEFISMTGLSDNHHFELVGEGTRSDPKRFRCRNCAVQAGLYALNSDGGCATMVNADPAWCNECPACFVPAGAPCYAPNDERANANGDIPPELHLVHARRTIKSEAPQ